MIKLTKTNNKVVPYLSALQMIYTRNHGVRASNRILSIMTMIRRRRRRLLGENKII